MSTPGMGGPAPGPGPGPSGGAGGGGGDNAGAEGEEGEVELGLGGGRVYSAKPSKGPATFAEMGFQGAKAEDKECVIM